MVASIRQYRLHMVQPRLTPKSQSMPAWFEGRWPSNHYTSPRPAISHRNMHEKRAKTTTNTATRARSSQPGTPSEIDGEMTSTSSLSHTNALVTCLNITISPTTHPQIPQHISSNRERTKRQPALSDVVHVDAGSRPQHPG